ncbi:MAG: phosphoenolpyruvate--protein phosphotransferase [Victivallaceae bacterium]
MKPRASEETFQAIPVSPGIAIGRVFVFRSRSDRATAPEDMSVAAEAIEDEVRRFHAALESTRAELTELREEIRRKLNTGEAGIFDAHLLIVEDQTLNSEVEKKIREEAKTADYAFYEVSEHYIAVLAKMPDEYLRERAADIRDVANRISAHLAPDGSGRLDTLTDRRIVVASDLAPSETARLDREKVLGFAIESGSSTSHTAILARSMRLPAVTGIPHELLDRLRADDKLIINGFDGKIILNPNSRTEDAYRLKAEEAGRFYSDLRRESTLMPETMDGFVVQLAGNLDAVAQAKELREAGACGIGLFRTEYLFLSRSILPDEEEQFEVYRSLLVATENRPVVVRTLDIGGDKLASALHHVAEQNPFLGLRGIRLCLRERRDILRTQLRALLRAGVYGSLRIMLPMVTLPSEVREVRDMIRTLQQELAREKLEFASVIPIGAMIETPAAALQAEKIAASVDFFSLGTNDLVQYTMAIDRGNERVTYLYQPAHPVILESIARCVRAARRHNIWVAVCGQMAGEPEYTPLLVGLGVHELSMDAEAIGPVRRVIRAMHMHEAEEAARAALAADSAEEAVEISLRLLRRVAPEIAALLSQ